MQVYMDNHLMEKNEGFLHKVGQNRSLSTVYSLACLAVSAKCQGD